MAFQATSDSGHTVLIDSAEAVGGQNRGPRPMEMVLMGMGGCSAIDVMSILQKKRQEVTDCVIDLDARRAETVPKVFTHIHARYVVTGRNVSEKAVERAVSLSMEKYCSATRMLASSVEITYDYVVREAEDT